MPPTDADAMREALAAHDEVLRKAIEAHGGWLFKHTGDGVCAAFASPRSAVDAAVAAQRKLELPVRMGTATGGRRRARWGRQWSLVLPEIVARLADSVTSQLIAQLLYCDVTFCSVMGRTYPPMSVRCHHARSRRSSASVVNRYS
jgi:hypothetical protein